MHLPNGKGKGFAPARIPGDASIQAAAAAAALLASAQTAAAQTTPQFAVEVRKTAREEESTKARKDKAKGPGRS